MAGLDVCEVPAPEDTRSIRSNPRESSTHSRTEIRDIDAESNSDGVDCSSIGKTPDNRKNIASRIVEQEEFQGFKKSGISSHGNCNGGILFGYKEDGLRAQEESIVSNADAKYPTRTTDEVDIALALNDSEEHIPALNAIDADQKREGLEKPIEKSDSFDAQADVENPTNNSTSDRVEESGTLDSFAASNKQQSNASAQHQSFISSKQQSFNSMTFQANPQQKIAAQAREFTDKLDSSVSKGEKIEAFFFNNGMSVALGGLFFAMNIVVGAHAAYQFTERGGFVTDDDILRITLPIARLGGRLVTFNCAWILITACKHMWTMIRSHVVPILPVGFPIDDVMPKYHRFIALWIIFFGCIIHGLPQILNYVTGAIAIDDGCKIWTFGNGMATRPLLITGILLMLIFAMFFLTTLKAFRKTAVGFRCFWWLHMVGIAFAYPLLIAHGTYRGHPIFLWCALSPLALYGFDVAMRSSKMKKTKILEWKTHKNESQNIVELVLECPPEFVYTPGQYVELNYSPISSSEWHSFTIASAPNSDIRIYNGKRVRVLIFFIQARGRWTNSFFHLASRFDLSKHRRREISVRGPHGAPASNFFEYEHIVVIGSGVGVTPLLSVWQFMMARARSGELELYDNLLMGSISKSLSKYSLKSLTNSLKSTDMDAMDNSSLDTFMMDADQCPGRFQLACCKVQGILESLTVSICLYGLFLIAETIIIVTMIFGYYTEVAWFEIVFASISLIIHIVTVIASVYAQNGGIGYYRLFKCWIEVAITLVDALNMWLCLSFLKKDQQENIQRSTRSIVALGAASVFLHVIRIFHVFYTTLKPNKTRKELQECGKRSKVSSIKGIFISPQYKTMKFCFDHLMKPVDEELSTVFKLQCFGTRERTSEIPVLSVMSGSADCSSSTFPTSKTSSPSQDFSFHNGRPDFVSLLQNEVINVQKSNQNGGEISIGVFLCGSPAIAKSLRSAADKVNAIQQHIASKKSSSKHCKCKIVLHIENF